MAPKAPARLGRETLLTELPKEMERLLRLHGKESLLRLPRGKTRLEYAGSFLEKVGAKPTKVDDLGRIISEHIQRESPDRFVVEQLVAAVAIRPEYRGALKRVLAAVELWAKGGKAEPYYAETCLEMVLECFNFNTDEYSLTADSLDNVRSLLPPLTTAR